MKLLTKALINKFAKIGSQEHVEDPIIIAKFFNPGGYATWYATEYFPKERLFFGYCDVLPGGAEWGYFSLDDLEKTKNRFGLHMERDRNFSKKFSELKISS